MSDGGGGADRPVDDRDGTDEADGRIGADDGRIGGEDDRSDADDDRLRPFGGVRLSKGTSRSRGWSALVRMLRGGDGEND